MFLNDSADWGILYAVPQAMNNWLVHPLDGRDRSFEYFSHHHFSCPVASVLARLVLITVHL